MTHFSITMVLLGLMIRVIGARTTAGIFAYYAVIDLVKLIAKPYTAFSKFIEAHQVYFHTCIGLSIAIFIGYILLVRRNNNCNMSSTVPVMTNYVNRNNSDYSI